MAWLNSLLAILATLYTGCLGTVTATESQHSEAGINIAKDGDASLSLLQQQHLSLLQERSNRSAVRLRSRLKARSALQSWGTAEQLEPIKRKCGIIWYYHIPKCGGSSVDRWLRDMKQKHHQLNDMIPLTTWGPDGFLRKMQTAESNINYTIFHDRFIEPFLQNASGRLIAIHHHDRGPGLYGSMQPRFADMKERLEAQGCDLFRVTFLREPEALLNSAMFYFDSQEQLHKDTVAPEDRRNELDQMQRIRMALSNDKIYDNLMVRYLLNNKGEYDGSLPRGGGAAYPMDIGAVNEEAVQAAFDILKSFEYVGFTEDIEGSLIGLSEMLGLQRKSLALLQHVNVHQHMDKTSLPEDLKGMMKKRTEADQLLYKWAKARFN